MLLNRVDTAAKALG